MLSRGMQNRRDILTKNFLRGSERQRLKTGNNAVYGPSEINDLSDMQVLEAIFLEIWRLCFLIFIERELILQQGCVHFSCTANGLSYPSVLPF